MQKSKVFKKPKEPKRIGLTLKKNVAIAVDNKIKNDMELPEENKVKNVMETQEFDLLRELPYEIFLKIMGYLSTSDILKKMAPVSKSFYQLSRDQNVIKRMEFKILGFTSDWIRSWTDERRKKYYDDFFKVLKNSQKLKVFSFDLDQQLVGNFYSQVESSCFYRNWMEPSVNLQYLEEFYIKIRNIELESCTDFLQYGVFDRCPKLKIFEIWRQHYVDYSPTIDYSVILNTIASFNSKSLQILHLYTPNTNPHMTNLCDPLIMKNVLKMMTENMPKIQYFNLTLNSNADVHKILQKNVYKICQEIASEKKIKIEIRSIEFGTRFVFV